jgi:Zn ribbon nucleic-acid-binding protein
MHCPRCSGLMMSSFTAADEVACVNCGHYEQIVSDDAQAEVTENLGRRAIKGEYVVLPVFSLATDTDKMIAARRRHRTAPGRRATKTFSEGVSDLISEMLR